MMKHFFTPEFKVTYSGGWEFKMRSLEHCTVALQNVNWGSISRFRLLYRNEGYFCRLITERSSSTFLKPLGTAVASTTFSGHHRTLPCHTTVVQPADGLVLLLMVFRVCANQHSTAVTFFRHKCISCRHLIECFTSFIITLYATIKNVLRLSCFKDLQGSFNSFGQLV